MSPAAVQIGILRLRAVADTPALRLAVARELGGAELEPPGLPPSAVLVVRRLADPLPRRLGRRGAFRPPAAWQRAARKRLAEKARRAARPDRRGRLPPSAEAVVFADRAEMLAALARDLARGVAASRWWWRAARGQLRELLPGAVPAGASRDPAPVLAGSPRELPAILDRLASWGAAGDVLAALARDGASRALAALAREHRLPASLVRPPASPATDSADGAPDEPEEPSATGPRTQLPPRAALDPPGARVSAPEGEREPAVEPWLEWLPPALRGARLGAEARCLAGIGLGLCRAPHRVRSPGFARRARRWWRAVAAGPAASGVPAGAGSGAVRCPGSDPRQPTAAFPRAAAARPPEIGDDPMRGAARSDVAPRISVRKPSPPPTTPADAAADPANVQDRAAAPAGPPGRPDLRPGLAETEDLRPRRRQGPPATVPRPEAYPRPAAEPARPADSPSDGREAPPDSAPTAPEGPASLPEPESATLGGEEIVTRWGGVLYLIHAMDALDLPRSFEDDWGLATAAGAWGTLDLLGRGLLASRFPEIASDPLWRSLESLAGWPAAGGGGEQSAAPAYRLPNDSWHALAAGEAGLSWAAAGGRLLLWCDAGFLIADVPRSAALPPAQAAEELERLYSAGGLPVRPRRRRSALAPRAPVAGVLPRGCPARLGLWLEAIVPALRRRLDLALGFRDSVARDPVARDPVERLLAVPGRLYLTSSHVDLQADLEHIWLPARAAGLDRDPGWRRDLGRVVLFHFR